jgi:hypothetical protein
VRRYIPMIVLSSVLLSGLLAGCSSTPATPLAYFQGKWACTQNETPEVKGTPLNKWRFDISAKRMTMSTPPGSGGNEENYVFKDGTLTLTDVGRSGLQQGYKEPVTAKFPKTMPAAGKVFNTAVQLPNGDTWGLKITVDGNKATLKVAQPEDELWACTRN